MILLRLCRERMPLLATCKMKKALCLFIVVLFLFSVSGCRMIRNALKPWIQNTPKPAQTEAAATEDATNTPATPAPEATTAPESEADLAFKELDLEIFRKTVVSCTDSYNQFIVSDPGKFGIDPNDVTPGWGDITYESHVEQMDEAREYLGRLASIDYASLSDMNKHAYDALKRYYEVVLMYEDYYYFDEPLTPLNGYHSLLPLSMICFNVRCADDVENYMILIEDMARLIDQIEQFEIEKADHGLFMCEVALDQVIESCEKFADKGEDSFLISYFEEVIEKAEGFGFTAEQCEELRVRNKTAVLDQILPAYQHLADTLDSLRDKCTPFVGACMRSDEAAEYFSLSARDEGATLDDMETVVGLLEKMGDRTLKDFYNAINYGPKDILDRYGEDISFGSVDDNIEWLTGFIEEYYPPMPEYSLKYVNVPEDIADDFSPAAYLTASYDDYYDNLMLLNPTSEGADDLLTVAHETLPGHMYQFLYARNMEGLSLAQQITEPTGYAEAWTVFTEDFVAKHCTALGKDFCTMTNSESTFCNVFMPAYISILVNYYGWDEDDVYDYLSDYGLGSAADIFYEYAITMPTYAMSYAIGYSYLSAIYSDAGIYKSEDIMAFFEKYLSYGPTYMDIIRDYMD